MSRQARDYWLAENADAIMDTAAGNAVATIVVLKPPTKNRDLKRVEYAKEIGQRLQHYILAVQPLTLTYRPDMPEAELREWAAMMVEALKG